MTNGISCPRCHYDLRAITEPRCPECGLVFTWDAWQTGLIRDEVPSAMDRVDPWQPHAVLWAALVEMVGGAFAPQRILGRIALYGPRHATPLMLIAGAFWVYLSAAGLLALATALHRDVSPYLAITGALLSSAPLYVASALAAGLLSFLVAAAPGALRTTQNAPRALVRLAAHWIPSTAVAVAFPAAAATLAIPDFPAKGGLSLAMLIPLAHVLVVAVSTPRNDTRKPAVGRLYLAAVSLVVWVILAMVVSNVAWILDRLLWALSP